MKKCVISLLGLLILSSSAAAEEKKKLYRWVDKHGNVHYSDEPRAGADEIEMKEIPAIKMKKPKIDTKHKVLLEKPEPARYQEFSNAYRSLTFLEPQADGVVRNNASAVSFKIQIEPTLLEGHSIRLFLDGKPVTDDLKSGEFVATKVAYGTHSASFIVVDATGKQLQSSETIKFNLLHNINPKIRNQRK
ncbi:DUF4124 domain-containing protein [Aliikangiella coralliicola]|uniref:DUF4124 domain-containing protein n=1 Tax=Aliikangiella coralliicola TaxID=2592383 RepID=A0A545UI57_9GAMM|nr:DUF4124 domain-containing protein [Aliikangiella coralliicola]TQV89149.1 DUF4124 domain-containing protein [Aliikangiella coralliicola]